ncbi:MAG: ATP cone domain-containing protein, partial [Patescibacteria group bacterium]
MFRSIKKRNGKTTPFKIEKIVNAVYKASIAVGESNWQLANHLAKEVANRLQKKLKRGAVATVEEVQDMVEAVLIDSGRARIAKAYILYRQHRAEIRQEKQQILDKEEIDEIDKKFDLNALRVLASRYLKKDESGKVIESPKQLFERVATHAVLPSLFYDDKIYKKNAGAGEHRIEEFDCQKFEDKFSIGKYKLNQFHLDGAKRLYDRLSKHRKIKVSWSAFLNLLKNGYFDKYENEISGYYDLMVSRRFLPNTPALANFGNYFGMGSACFVLGIEDSIDRIMDSLKAAAIIFKSGGGVGYNFSHLRPEGDFVKTTGGAASGPISFMSMFDNMTEVIKQGGIRRGANMGILNSDHPDIEKFIKAKEGNRALRNFNISVMFMPEFWKAYKEDKPYDLINPRNGKVFKSVDPKQIFDIISHHAWESAEPGILFNDRINEYNPFLKSLGPIESTNPC